MIGGAQKSGTTSLARYFGAHPGIHMHWTREFPYFVDPPGQHASYEAAYRGAFEGLPADDQVVAAKSATWMYRPNAMDRFHAHNPDAYILTVLRNPIDRAHSAFWHMRRMGIEDLDTFEQAVRAPADRFQDELRQIGTRYLVNGEYAGWLDEVEKRFPRDRIMVVLLEDLIADAQAIIRDVEAQMDMRRRSVAETAPHANSFALPRSERLNRMVFAPPKPLRKLAHLLPEATRNKLRRRIFDANQVAAAKPKMAPATRAELVEHFRDHNAALAKRLGRDLSHWDK